ncbi:MAG: GGDEF domain-containing protein [Vampirovibrionales bacterium]|nr:GGDEF domain-containing protein [Vampirovibrionales bacterium]
MPETLNLAFRLCRQWLMFAAGTWALWAALQLFLLPRLGVAITEPYLVPRLALGIASVIGAGFAFWLMQQKLRSRGWLPPAKTFMATATSAHLAQSAQMISHGGGSEDPVARKQYLKYARLMVMTLSGLFTVQYALSSGWLGAVMLPAAPIGLAFFLGLNRLGFKLGIAYAATLLVGIQLGWPQRLALTMGGGDSALSPVIQALLLALALVPTLAMFICFASMVSMYVRVTVAQAARLMTLAATDALTGLANRGQFNKRLVAEVSRAKRYNQPMCLALLDIDYFKQLNDKYGHLVGDQVLRELAQLLGQSVRESDLPARYGGEEFALILPQTSLAAAHDLMDRIRQVVARKVFCGNATLGAAATPLRMSISIGVAQINPKAYTPTALIAAADGALYAAKRGGRNRVQLADPVPVAAQPVRKSLPPAMGPKRP